MIERRFYERLFVITTDLIVQFLYGVELVEHDSDIKDLVLSIENNYIYGYLSEEQYNGLIFSIRKYKKMFKLLREN